MSQIDIDAAAADLHGLVARARSGEDVVLVADGQEVVRLVPVAPRHQEVRLGLAEGRWKVPDDFDAPLPDDVLALFYDGPLFPDERQSEQPDDVGR
jgi:prevent-host-death family protein